MQSICDVLRACVREREIQIRRLEKEIDALRIVISLEAERTGEGASPDAARPFPPRRAEVAELRQKAQRLP